VKPCLALEKDKYLTKNNNAVKTVLAFIRKVGRSHRQLRVMLPESVTLE